MPEIVKSLPIIVQKFITVVCKQGVDPKKSIEVGNLGYDSGYDWCANVFIPFCSSFPAKMPGQFFGALFGPLTQTGQVWFDLWQPLD